MRSYTVRLALVLMAGASLAACSTVQPRYATELPGAAKPPPRSAGAGRYKVGDPYQVGGVWYVPREQPDYDEVGVASWYGDAFNMKPTANGEIFDMNAVSAAHTTLPLPSIVEVTNLENGRKLRVRVNDRGPFVGDRIIDLSHEAARELGYDRQGLAKVRVRYIGPAPLLGPDAGVRYADARVEPPRPRALPLPPPEADPVMELAAGGPSRAPYNIPAQEVSFARVPQASVATRPLAPIAPVDTRPLPPPAAPVAIASAGPSAASSPLRIQAGAYSSETNAQRAVAQLATCGNAVIEPVWRETGTFYRVMLPAPADEVEAYALRDRVASIGFTDARVVQAF
jgi:rare lipoprotein A